MNNRTAKKIRRAIKADLAVVAPFHLTGGTEYELTDTHVKYMSLDPKDAVVVSDPIKLKRGLRSFVNNAKHNYKVLKAAMPFASGDALVAAAVAGQ